MLSSRLEVMGSGFGSLGSGFLDPGSGSGGWIVVLEVWAVVSRSRHWVLRSGQRFWRSE